MKKVIFAFMAMVVSASSALAGTARTLWPEEQQIVDQEFARVAPANYGGGAGTLMYCQLTTGQGHQVLCEYTVKATGFKADVVFSVNDSDFVGSQFVKATYRSVTPMPTGW